MASASQRAEEAQSFAARELGPISTRLLSHPDVMALILSRARDGLDMSDAVLAEIHARLANDGELANEFLAYFLSDLYRLGSPMISPGLHRFLDTWDLAQSVLGDLWPNLSTIEFRTRREFLSLLAQRLRWKSADGARKTERSRELTQEELRTSHAAHEPAARERSPASQVAGKDEEERLILSLLRLSSRDRRLVQAHLRSEPIEELMAELDLGYEAARKAQQRALQRARELFDRRSA